MNQREKDAFYDAQRARQLAEAARQRRFNEDATRLRNEQTVRQAKQDRYFAQQSKDRSDRENQRVFRENMSRTLRVSDRQRVPKDFGLFAKEVRRETPLGTGERTKGASKSRFVALMLILLFSIWLLDEKNLGEWVVYVFLATVVLTLLYRLRFVVAKAVAVAAVTIAVILFIHWFM